MDKIIKNSNGDIDWNANGWPEPSPYGIAGADGYDMDDMPDEVFDIWISECEEFEDFGVDE